jgi:hypothetical protein
MTIISALRCSEGIVLTSDSREMRGPAAHRLARDVQKIYEPRRGFLVGWAGWQGVAQAFALGLERAPDLSPTMDRVEVKRRLEAIIRHLRDDGETDYAEWIVAWWSESDKKPVALHIFSNRPGEWVTDWACGGDARPIEIATVVSGALRFVPRDTLTLEQAKVLALKITRDTIHIGVESIGGEVQVGAVSRGGVELLGGTQLKGLHDTLDVWEEQAADLLPGSIPVPGRSSTPDRGLRPS